MARVNKVWRCTYIGPDSAAPSVIDVPSENACGRPTGREIYEALLNMGYSDAKASAIANGGSTSCWRCS